jgi:hypothetical protein
MLWECEPLTKWHVLQSCVLRERVRRAVQNVMLWIYMGHRLGRGRKQHKMERIGKLRRMGVDPSFLHPLINCSVPPCSLNPVESLCATEPINSRGMVGSIVPTKLYFQILRNNLSTAVKICCYQYPPLSIRHNLFTIMDAETHLHSVSWQGNLTKWSSIKVCWIASVKSQGSENSELPILHYIISRSRL